MHACTEEKKAWRSALDTARCDAKKGARAVTHAAYADADAWTSTGLPSAPCKQAPKS